MMDTDKMNSLNEQDAKKLIKSEKYPDDLLEFNDVYKQVVDTLVPIEGVYTCEINDYHNEINYNMINRQTERDDKFSIMLIMPNNIHLIRFDFGSETELKHTNNLGEENEYVVHGSHVHILSSSDVHVKKNVIPIENISEFANLNTMKDAFKKAVTYLNIKREEENNNEKDKG